MPNTFHERDVIEKEEGKVYIYAFIINVGTADRKSNNDPSSEIQRAGSQADLGTCPEWWRTYMLLFKFRRRQTSWPLLFMRNTWNTQKRKMSKTTQRCQKQKGKKEAEDRGELIEIDPEILGKIMNAPTISKGNITIFLSHANYIGKRRIAFLLKDNWKKGMVRKEGKQYQTSLGVFGQSNTNLGFRKSSLRKD